MLSRKNWRPEWVILFVVPLIGLLLLGAAAHLLNKRPASPAGPMNFRDLVLNPLLFQGAMLAGVAFFLRAHQVGWREAFGCTRGTNGRAVLWGVVLAVLVLPCGYGLQYISAQVMERLGWPAEAQSPVELLLAGSWGQRAYLGVFAVVLAPLAEETLFRGIFFVFVRDLGFPRLALWGTGVFFGLIHGNVAAFLPLTMFGTLLAWLYARTGNLVACVTAHALFNLAPFIMIAFGINLDAGR